MAAMQEIRDEVGNSTIRTLEDVSRSESHEPHGAFVVAAVAAGGCVLHSLRLQGDGKCTDKGNDSYKEELAKLRHDLEAILSGSEQQNRSFRHLEEYSICL